MTPDEATASPLPGLGSVPLRFPGEPEELGPGVTLLADRSFFGELAVRGAGRASFLHGQCSNEVKALRPGSGTFVTFLTPKGKLLGDVDLLVLEDEIRLRCSPLFAAPLAAHLRKFAVFDKVEIVDLAPERSLFWVDGEGAAALVESVVGAPLPAGPAGANALLRRGDDPLLVSSCDRLGTVGFDLSIAKSAAGSLHAALVAAGARPAGWALLERLRIEAGRPRLGVDMDDSNLPNEAGLVDSISYTKGCYTGQETIARLRTYGHVNKRLVGFRIEGTDVPAPETPLSRDGDEGKPPGRVTSAALSPALGVVALGYAAKEIAEGDALRLPDGRAAVVAPLPLVRRGDPSPQRSSA